MKAKTVKISELTPDNINANKGTARGSAMLEKSLREYGAGRSVLVDKAGRIIAGNKTIEAAGSIGLEDAVVVETDGSQVVIVKRTDLDLDSPQGRGLAIADNRVAEVGLDWDMEALEKIGAELNLGNFWFDDELPEIDFGEIDDGGAAAVSSERNAAVGQSLTDLFDNYESRQIKTLTLAFAGEEYDEVIQLLNKACEKFGVDDFSLAVLEVLRASLNN